MSSQQNVTITISANDRATSVVSNVEKKIDGVGKAAGKATEGAGGLSNAIAFGMVKAQAAIALVQGGVSRLQEMLQQASTIELENLSTATGLEGMIGSFEKATEFVDGLNTALAKSAAALPGATAEYASLARTITDDVAVAFKDANGKIGNMPAFQKTVESMATSYSAMAATTPGVSNQDMQNFMIKALGGTSSQAELNQLDALQKNAPLRTRLEAAMKKLGATDLKQLTTPTRIALMEQVGRQVITPQFLAQSQNTVEGLTQSFISSVFDPMGGIFGVMKDLEPKVKGQQTAFEAFKVSLKLVIGSGGLFEQIGGLFGAVTGLDNDSPMKGLRGGFLWVNGYLTQLNKGLESVRGLLGKQSPLDVLQNLGSGLKLPSPSEIGQRLADAVDGVMNKGVDILKSLDYGAIASIIGKGIVALVQGAGAFFINLDASTWMNLALIVLGGAALAAIGGFAASLLAGFIAATVGLPGVLILAAVLALEALAKAIADNWDVITAVASKVFNKIAGVFGNYFDMVIGFFTGDTDRILKGAKGLGDFILSIFDKIKGMWAWITGTNTQVPPEQINPAEQKQMASAASNYVAKYDGNLAQFLPSMKSASGGLFSALSEEIRNMPSGASPIIANSSELVVPRSQIGGMVRDLQGQAPTALNVSATPGQNSKAITINYSPTIQMNGSGGTESQARELLRMFNVFFSEYVESSLA